VTFQCWTTRVYALRHVSFIMLGLLAMAGTSYAEVTTPLWSAAFEQDIKWYKTTPAGILIVGTNEGIHGLDPTNGEIIWRFDEMKKPRAGDFEPIEFTPYALLSLQKKVRGEDAMVILMDIETGEELWDSQKFGLGESYGFFTIHHAGVLLLFGKMAAKPQDKTLIAVELETGSVMWRDTTFWDRIRPNLNKRGRRKTLIGHQPPIYDSDTTMILFLNAKAICKYNIYTGEMLWEIKAPKPTSASADAVWLSEDDQDLYALYSRRANIFRTSDGQPRWTKPEKLPVHPDQFAVVPEGILIHTSPEKKEDAFRLLLLNLETGKNVWKINADHRSTFERSMGAGADATGFAIHNSTAVYASGEEIHAIDIATGEKLELTRDVQIPKSDDLRGIEVRDSGYFVTTNQTLTLINWDGSTRYSVHHEAPSGFGAGLGMLITALAVQAIAGGDHSLGGGFSVSIRPNFDAIFERMSSIYEATADADNYTYLLVMLEDGDKKSPGLMKIHKDTGETVRQLILDDKTPDYQLDIPWGRMFFRNDKRGISCYDF